MANNNKHTGPNVPALRFPEFSGEWECVPLSTYAKKITEKNIGNKIKNVLCNSATRGIVPQSEYFDREIANNENTDGYYVVRNQDFVYNPRKSVSAPYGPVNIYNGEDDGIISPLYLCMKIRGIDKNYLLHYFKSPAWYPYIYQNGDSGVRHDRVSIKDEVFLAMPVSVPNGDEQRKIAKFLDAINERIATQTKIIEELTTLRSALYDSMFCSPEQEMPKFRIQSFSGKWQLRKLNEICSRKSIKNKDNLYSRVLTIAAQHGLVDQESFFKKRIASENLESYLCLEKGDFAYNKSYSSDYPWGAVKRLSNFDKGIISPLYICFTPKPEVVDPDYLAHYFESTKWHSGISEISGEGARNHGLLNMSVIDYFNTCHRIPGLDEQKAIARRLNAIAHKLQTEQEYLELLNRQKDCFLKQMFI